MKNTQQLAKRPSAAHESIGSTPKQFRGKFGWVLLSLIVWAAATASAHAHGWKHEAQGSREYQPVESLKNQPKESWTYHSKYSWKYHRKQSWKYHPKKSWKYHPKKSWKYHRTWAPLQPGELDPGVNAYAVACAQPVVGQPLTLTTPDWAQVGSIGLDVGRSRAEFLRYPSRSPVSILAPRCRRMRPAVGSMALTQPLALVPRGQTMPFQQ